MTHQQAKVALVANVPVPVPGPMTGFKSSEFKLSSPNPLKPGECLQQKAMNVAPPNPRIGIALKAGWQTFKIASAMRLTADDFFAIPMMGPFVEKNGLSGAVGDVEHVGAAIHWSSAAGAYHLDLVRLASSTFWQDHLGFAQLPDLGFERFVWDCFAHSSRLTEFLNELRPFIRPCQGAPTPAPAAEWLNAKLVSCGFSLGIPKAQPNRVRVPVVWVFGNTSKDWGSQRAYARVDFVDWTPDHVRLVRRYDGDCWGTGARSLRRHLHQIVDAGCGPLLTEKGLARMEELHRRARTKSGKPAPDPVRLGAADLRLASDLRSRLRELVHPLSMEVAGQIDRLPPKAYVGVLTTCHTRGLEPAACAMMRHRRLPDYGQSKLLEKFVSSRWVEAFELCAAELRRAICSSEYGCSPLMRKALDTGDADAVRRLLGALPSITEDVVAVALEYAFEQGREDIALAILAAPVVQPIREAAMLKCFKHCLYEWCDHRTIASRMLELGVRPLKAIDKHFFLSPQHELLASENLPVLKRALELDPPTAESLSKLMQGFYLKPGATLDWLCTVSRGMPGHIARMSRIMSQAAFAFIYRGEAPALALLDRAASEGGTLADIPQEEIDERRFLQGYGWQARRDNLIDLIGHLKKGGRSAEVEALKRIKRAPKPDRPQSQTICP